MLIELLAGRSDSGCNGYRDDLKDGGWVLPSLLVKFSDSFEFRDSAKGGDSVTISPNIVSVSFGIGNKI